MKKIPKKDLIKIIIMLLAFFTIAGFGLYLYGRMQRKEEVINIIKVANTIEKYGYTLNDNASSYYKQEFEILKEMANNETSNEELIKQIAKLYCIDLLSLNSKINKYEVTSSQYYYSDKQAMHTQKVIDNFYNLIEDNAYDDRKQLLPEVTNVEVTDFKESTYNLSNTKVDSYEINLTITYQEDMGYDKNVQVILVAEGEKYSVVSYNSNK